MAAQIRAELAHHSIQELQVLLRFVHRALPAAQMHKMADQCVTRITIWWC